jgi:hypothetical protein
LTTLSVKLNQLHCSNYSELGWKDAANALRKIANLMKILLAIDGSASSRAALEQAIARPWPPKTEIRVVSVAHTSLPILVDPLQFTLAAVRHELLERDRQRASRDVDEATNAIRVSAPKLNVTSEALEGFQKKPF